MTQTVAGFPQAVPRAEPAPFSHRPEAAPAPASSLDPQPPEPEKYDSFAYHLLTPRDGEVRSLAADARRLGVGLGLASLFGGALGLRAGGAAIAGHALGVTAGLFAVAAVAAPAFAIVLALVNAPVDGQTLARATSRAVARAGLLLGGLAPAAALYVVTVEDAITVTIVGLGGLLVAGAVAASSFARELRAPLADAADDTRRWMAVAMPAFILFAAALAIRVWWLAVPVIAAGVK
jgi:hypothetical protein